MFFFGFTVAITLFSIINTVLVYRTNKKRLAKMKEEESTEAEFMKAMEEALGVNFTKPEEKKPARILSIVKKDDDDEDPTLH